MKHPILLGWITLCALGALGGCANGNQNPMQQIEAALNVPMAQHPAPASQPAVVPPAQGRADPATTLITIDAAPFNTWKVPTPLLLHGKIISTSDGYALQAEEKIRFTGIGNLVIWNDQILDLPWSLPMVQGRQTLPGPIGTTQAYWVRLGWAMVYPHLDAITLAPAGTQSVTYPPGSHITVSTYTPPPPAPAAPVEPASPAPDDNKVMSVVAVQKSLNDFRFYVGRPDGVLGPVTRRQLMRFQAAAHLPVTGKIDLATSKAIRQNYVGAEPFGDHPGADMQYDIQAEP